MSVTEQLRELAHHGYPSSGAEPWHDDLGGEPFGPGGDTSLSDAARPVTMYGFPSAAVRPTESQAARAQTRAELATQMQAIVPGRSEPGLEGGVSSQVGALPVLTPGQIEADKAGVTPRPQGAAATRPVTQISRRGTAQTMAVERPETSAVPHEPAPATTQVPRGVYPSTRTRVARSSKDKLKSMIRGDAAPTAPMRVVDRLTATPFHNLRRFGDSNDRQARRTLNFALRLAETMFHYGADALDVENAIIAVCATYGVENLEVDITNQSVTINYVAEITETGKLTAAGHNKDGTGQVTKSRTSKDVLDDPNTYSHTVMRVVRSWTDNYAGLANSHQLVTRIIEGTMPLKEAERELSEINAQPKPYPKWAVWLATVFAAATITTAIGGGAAGALVASVSSVLVQIVSSKLGAWRIPEFFALAANALIVTLAAMGISSLGVDLSPPKVIAGGIIMLLVVPALLTPRIND